MRVLPLNAHNVLCTRPNATRAASYGRLCLQTESVLFDAGHQLYACI